MYRSHTDKAPHTLKCISALLEEGKLGDVRPEVTLSLSVAAEHAKTPDTGWHAKESILQVTENTRQKSLGTHMQVRM